MRQSTKSILLVAVSIGFAVGCQKPTQEDSELEHAFGKTTHTRLKPLESCKNDEPGPGSKDLKLANEYVKKIAERIFSRNLKSAKVFTGFLAPTNFCVGVEKDDKLNAYAQPNNGVIRVSSGMLLVADSDALIAGVVGHEMAHITMDHSRTLDVFADRMSPAEYTQARGDERKLEETETEGYEVFQKILIVLENAKITLPRMNKGVIQGLGEILKSGHCGSHCKEIENVKNKLTAIEKKIESLENDLQSILAKHFQPDELKNKKESDADEIGLEFMVRADIEPAKMEELQSVLARRLGNANTCYGLGTLTRQGGTHPEYCWRVNNIGQEREIHRKQYARFLINREVNFITSPTLAEVKEEILAKDAVLSGKNPPGSNPTPVR